MQLVVGISEMIVTREPTDSIITYSLGSCVGLTVYDPRAMVGGQIHCMLPLSKIDKNKAAARPAMFVDTGVIALLSEVFNLGATKENLVACVAGGAAPLDIQTGMKIGERNFAMVRKVLWKNGILISAQDIGGTIARTMRLDMRSGGTTLRSQGKEWLMEVRAARPARPRVAAFANGARGVAQNAS